MQPRHRNAGPLAHDFGDVFRVDLLLQHLLGHLHDLERGGGLLDLLLELGQLAVTDLGRAREVAIAFEAVGLGATGLELLLEAADLGDRVLLALPVRLHRGGLLTQVGQFLVERGQALARRLVGLLGQRDPLDLELADAPLDDVDLGRHRVDLDAQPAARLVDEVDRLVGEEAPGDVAVGEHGRRHERGILDAHAVVHLVALLEAAEDGDRVLHRRLTDEHLLEATLERGVLLDVLAVLVERRGADQAQLAARQHRLDHVARVHRALGRARADDRVQLVDERDHLALGVGDLLEHGLQPLLELTAVLRARNHRADVERDEPLVLQTFGHVALDDATGQPLDDGGLADAGLADQHRVVLGAARQHLDDAADLLVAPDDRVELARARRLGEVAPVALEGAVLLLRRLAGDAVAAAHVLQDVEQLLARQAHPVGHGEQQVLGGQVVVVELRPLAVGRLQRVAGGAGELRLGAAVGLRQPRQCLVDAIAHGERRQPELLEHGKDDTFLLARAARPAGARA